MKVRLNGRLVYEEKNLVVNAGLRLIANLLAGGGPAVPGWIGVGSSGAEPAGSQTALQGTEHYRVVASKTPVDNAVNWSADFTGQNSELLQVREFGLFNAASAGTMLCRFVCPLLEWDVGDYLGVDWTLTIGELT